MRNQWYGDHRDIVKWGTLMRLAREHQIGHILQIAFFRPDTHVPLIALTCGESEEIAREVLRHFRDVRQIKGLADLAELEIEVFDRPFGAQFRDAYIEAVIQHIRAMNGKASVILLDPDTGLSNNRKSSAHIMPEEVKAIWASLGLQDWLVLYQHASRENNWIEKRRAVFEVSCSGGQILEFRSSKGARDVVFFAASHNYRLV